MASRCKPSNKRLGLVWVNQYAFQQFYIGHTSRWCVGKVLVKKGTIPPDIDWARPFRKQREKDIQELCEFIQKFSK